MREPELFTDLDSRGAGDETGQVGRGLNTGGFRWFPVQYSGPSGGQILMLVRSMPGFLKLTGCTVVWAHPFSDP